MMPTAAERSGDFSQTRTPAGGLIAIRDPLTNQPFPGNVIPLNRADPRSLALLNMLPMPNTTGSGYNFVDQEAEHSASAAPASAPRRLSGRRSTTRSR